MFNRSTDDIKCSNMLLEKAGQKGYQVRLDDRLVIVANTIESFSLCVLDSTFRNYLAANISLIEMVADR